MNVITRLFTKQVLHSTKYTRQISISTVLHHKNEQKYKSSQRSNYKNIVISCGICTGIIGYGILNDRFSELIPDMPIINAATLPTPRTQVNLMQFLLLFLKIQ